MATPARPTIGKCKCAHCGTDSDVRKNQNSKLYYVCPSCGIVQPALPGFQSWMMDNADLWPEGIRPESVENNNKKPDATPEPSGGQTGPTLKESPETPEGNTPQRNAPPPKESPEDSPPPPKESGGLLDAIEL